VHVVLRDRFHNEVGGDAAAELALVAESKGPGPLRTQVHWPH
jgi:hypothetical protein